MQWSAIWSWVDTVGCIDCLVDIGNAHLLTAQWRFTTCITNLYHQPESNIHTSSTFCFVLSFLQRFRDATDYHTLVYYHVIDLFRGACAVKGNVQVAGHVKRIDNGAAFNAWRYVRRRWRIVISYSNLIFHGSPWPIWAKLREYFSICNVIVTE